MKIWKDTYRPKRKSWRRKPEVERRMTRDEYKAAQERIGRLMQDHARRLRDCEHSDTVFAWHLANDDYDQDTAEIRCRSCGLFLEDLS